LAYFYFYSKMKNYLLLESEYQQINKLIFLLYKMLHSHSDEFLMHDSVYNYLMFDYLINLSHYK